VRESVTLPSQVFCRGFDKYAFFDLDIATSFELAEGVGNLIRSCLGEDEAVEVFSSVSRERLATLVMGDGWPNKLAEVGKSLRDAGDCGGLILLSVSGKWAAFQSQPVDIGVLALNCDVSLTRSVLDVDGCFFDCEDVSQWRHGETDRDASIRENFGVLFLDGLLANYCDSTGGRLIGPAGTDSDR
jgi:hypothetical protein